MPKFSTNVPHSLGAEGAKSALQHLLEHLTEKYGDQVSELEQSWDEKSLNFALKTYGFRVTGVVLVEEDQVKLDGDLPFAAAMFKGKIEDSIRSALERTLQDRSDAPPSHDQK